MRLEHADTLAEDGSSRVLNLFYPSKGFCQACQTWDKYDEQEMSVILKPIKRYAHALHAMEPGSYIRSDLPYYCFPDGQPKPKKKTKRGQTNVCQMCFALALKLTSSGCWRATSRRNVRQPRAEQAGKVSRPRLLAL